MGFDERELLSQLASASPEARRKAAKDLGENAGRVSKRAEVAWRLVEALEGQDQWEHVRMWAAWALGEIRDKCAIPTLRRNLRDTNRDVKVLCAWALAKIGDPVAVPDLIEFVRSDDDTICQENGLDALGRFRSHPEVKRFLRERHDDPQTGENIRAVIDEILARWRGPGGRTVCQLLFDDFDVDIGGGPKPITLPPCTADRVVLTTRPPRDSELSERIKRHYGHVCQVCGVPGFEGHAGAYSEVHHIIPLRLRGKDHSHNMLVVCPLCHRKLHYARSVVYDPDPWSGGRPVSVSINGAEPVTIRWLD